MINYIWKTLLTVVLLYIQKKQEILKTLRSPEEKSISFNSEIFTVIWETFFLFPNSY